MEDVLLIALLPIILVQQSHRDNLLKIISSAIYFWIVYKVYDFSNPISNLPFFGYIFVFMFYQFLELFDRKVLSYVTYGIVGAILEDKNAPMELYTLCHLLLVRLVLLYLIVLPLLDHSIIFAVISFLGLFVVTFPLYEKYVRL